MSKKKPKATAQEQMTADDVANFAVEQFARLHEIVADLSNRVADIELEATRTKEERKGWKRWIALFRR